MKTVILCGGRGTRIRDVAEHIPKPMVPLGNRPILWHLMQYYAHWGNREFILCLGYKGNVIRRYFATSHQEPSWTVTPADTGLNTMTGGRIKRIQKYVASDNNFMLTYGDGLGTIDLKRLLAFHLSHGKILTVSGVRPPSRFGELQMNPKGLITAFNEKPQVSQGRISGGFFVCRKEIFRYLNNRIDLVFEQEPIRRLVRDRQAIVYKHDGFWQPMDTYRDYLYLNGLLKKRKAPWVLWK